MFAEKPNFVTHTSHVWYMYGYGGVTTRVRPVPYKCPFGLPVWIDGQAATTRAAARDCAIDCVPWTASPSPGWSALSSPLSISFGAISDIRTICPSLCLSIQSKVLRSPSRNDWCRRGRIERGPERGGIKTIPERTGQGVWLFRASPTLPNRVWAPCLELVDDADQVKNMFVSCWAPPPVLAKL